MGRRDYIKTTVGEARGLSLKEQSDILGISEAAVSIRVLRNYEQRYRLLMTLDRIAFTTPADEIENFKKQVNDILSKY